MKNSVRVRISGLQQEKRDGTLEKEVEKFCRRLRLFGRIVFGQQHVCRRRSGGQVGGRSGSKAYARHRSSPNGSILLLQSIRLKSRSVGCLPCCFCFSSCCSFSDLALRNSIA
uniref:Uncharacterized protein n=1 Tax=Trichuris muris TaxID=70415 RepID=A0A5S6Q0Z7_TRIMR